jgi:mono/diheme cytochrome c family protein
MFEQGELFSTSGACAICHTNLRDEADQDISIDTSWRSTMMANSARDPYWQATVRTEALANPQIQDEIEDSCATCHMPMARFDAASNGEEVRILADGFLSSDNPRHTFAMDGVSCALCHQVRASDLGTSASFTGGFVIDTELRAPDRVVFGPYQIEGDQAQLMQLSSGFRPEQGLHLSQSEMCASCHTVYTPYVDGSGAVAGTFPEQVPYLEWFYSDYRRTQTCQGCHMPDAQGGVKIANSSQVLRSPFAIHAFVGGNAYILELLKMFGEELGVTASTEQFEATIQRTLNQLQNQTASIAFDEVRRSGSRLIIDVSLENMAGHKFPTGFPSRRAWIRLSVEDGTGAVIFESGAYSSGGAISGNDNDEDPARFEQHYEAIVQESQVQIYEAVLQDTENHVTTTLLEAARYLKDNRLTPSGFEKAAPYEDIAVRGGAREDEDFQGGVDQIQYVVDLSQTQGPYTVAVELLYQSVGYRWAQNFRGSDASEVIRFLAYYDATPNEPVVIDRDVEEIGSNP